MWPFKHTRPFPTELQGVQLSMQGDGDIGGGDGGGRGSGNGSGGDGDVGGSSSGGDGDGGGDPSNTRSLSLLSARGIDSSAKDRVRLSA